MERCSFLSELLAIRTVLKKDPEEYSYNTYQRIVGTQVGAKEGDTIKYYKSTIKGQGHSNPSFLSRTKYLEMLRSTFEEQLKVLGYDFMNDVVGRYKVNSITFRR